MNNATELRTRELLPVALGEQHLQQDQACYLVEYHSNTAERVISKCGTNKNQAVWRALTKRVGAVELWFEVLKARVREQREYKYNGTSIAETQVN